MVRQQSSISVRKEIFVDAAVPHVFRVFTAALDSWWPHNFHVGKDEAFTAVLEGRRSGRWYERAADGSEQQWGSVLLWKPPSKVVLTWDINARWLHEPGLGTEVQAQFLPESPRGTRVILEHAKLERLGGEAQQMRAIFDSPGGWSCALMALKATAESTTTGR